MKTTFNLNTLKGRMAEHLIQDLFIHCGYNVFNYGMERIMPGILQQMKIKKDSPVAKAIRYMPDFVVQSNSTGELFYLEVKFRANGAFGPQDIDENYPYKNARFIIVSPQKIQAIHYNHLKKGNSITEKTNYSLLKINKLHIDAAILEEYVNYAKVMFEGLNKND